MSSDAWPSPDAPPGPLPRLDELPVVERGYDQEAVRLAFDSFYRHAAQLDASLRALEAVEVFRRDADALRNDLRALRSMGLGGGGADPSWTTPAYERPRPEVPAVVLRLAVESALIVAVAVIAGVAHLRSTTIVILMAVAFAIVALAEWLAARARFVPPAVAFAPYEQLEPAAPPPGESPSGEPAPYVEAPAPAWGAPAEDGAEPVGEDTEPGAATAGSAEEADEPDEPNEAADPWEQGEDAPSDDEVASPNGDAAPEPEVELAHRGGLFRRRRR